MRRGSSHYYRRSARRGPANRIISDYIRGVTVEFRVGGGVFSQRGVDEGTKLLLEHAIVPEEGVVLDLGCGYGVIGVTLAKAHPKLKVYMIDVNPVAVELARLNAKLNGVEDRVVVMQGDLYEPVRGLRFNAILSNPPLAAGWGTVSRIILEAPDHLEPGGLLELVFRKGEEKARKLMEEVFGSDRVRVLARKRGYTVLLAEAP